MVDRDDGNASWSEYRRLVIQELERLRRDVEALQHQMRDLQKRPGSSSFSLLSDPTVIKILVALGAIVVTLVTGKVVNFGG